MTQVNQCKTAQRLAIETATARNGGEYLKAIELSRRIIEHRRACPECRGELYKALWPNAEVAEETEIQRK